MGVTIFSIFCSSVFIFCRSNLYRADGSGVFELGLNASLGFEETGTSEVKTAPLKSFQVENSHFRASLFITFPVVNICGMCLCQNLS